MTKVLLCCIGFLFASFTYGQDSTYYSLNFNDKIPRNYNLQLQKADFYRFKSNSTLPLSEKIKLLGKVIHFNSKNKTGRKAVIYQDSILQLFADSLQREWKLEWVGSNYASDGEVPLEEDKEKIIFKENVIVQTKHKEQKTFEYKILSLGVDMWEDIFVTIEFDHRSWMVYLDEKGIDNRRASARVKEQKGKRFLYMQERWIACGAIEIFGSRPYSDKKK